ncbi:MAG: dephospho-CoA kinase [Spirochaetaceae bacterium]|nr:MAG: dephospho-CoA kinase [Spirochaetaceae bacterium]
MPGSTAPVVGIGGAYCSGKSTVARILIDAGYREINVDALGHRALYDCRSQVAAEFGRSVLDDNGQIDRAALGARVFTDAAALRRLECILHPRMVAMARESTTQSGETPIVMHAALLFHMGLDALCDVIIWVRAPLLLRIRRGVQRDNASLLRVLRIMWAQRKLRVQSGADSVDTHIVENRGNQRRLLDQLRHLNLPRI